MKKVMLGDCGGACWACESTVTASSVTNAQSQRIGLAQGAAPVLVRPGYRQGVGAFAWPSATRCSQAAQCARVPGRPRAPAPACSPRRSPQCTTTIDFVEAFYQQASEHG